MRSDYDLFIIGTGAAATGIASRCRAAGWSVGVCDDQPFGGTCPLRGCDPKKFLIAGAEAVDWTQRLVEKGVFKAKPVPDWAALMRHKRTFTDPFPGQREALYQRKGIDAWHGAARFVAADAVSVAGQRISARHFVIASGAQAIRLPIDGFELMVDNEGFLSLKTLPPRIALVGAGYVGLEFATIAAYAGAHVDVFEMDTQVLRGFEPQLAECAVARLRDAGVEFHLGQAVARVQRVADHYRVQAGDSQCEVDLVVNSSGRVPALQGLDLDAAGIGVEHGRLRLNAYLQSETNPAVYAAGDVTAPPLPLTPVAALQARTVAANLLEGNQVTPDYSGIPTAIFTLPPLARVGMLEAEAQQQGLKYRVSSGSAADWYTARRINESCYGWKVLVEEDSGRLLGAHLAGPDAGETINLFAMLMQNHLPAEMIRSLITTYPSATSDLEYMLP